MGLYENPILSWKSGMQLINAIIIEIYSNYLKYNLLVYKYWANHEFHKVIFVQVKYVL